MAKAVTTLTAVTAYTGRFAPSPTGLLHFGSLLAALASYLEARSQQGRWLLRIEDLDPPREHPDARYLIPKALQQFGLHWDGDISYQSQRCQAYQEAIEVLINSDLAYRCACSRKQIASRSNNNRYDGYCRQHPPTADQPAAIRLITRPDKLRLDDPIQGEFNFNLQQTTGDYVIHRKDGLFSYQLAVVVDDYLQGITHVVRGSDLLEETPRQQLLQQYLGYPQIQYSHIPVASNIEGQKLSKQNLAQPLDLHQPAKQLQQALSFLGQQPPQDLDTESVANIIDWATAHWCLEKIPKQRALVWQD